MILEPGKYYRARGGAIFLTTDIEHTDGDGLRLRGQEVEESSPGEWEVVDWWWFRKATGQWATSDPNFIDDNDLMEGPFDNPYCLPPPEPVLTFIKPGPKLRALILE